MNRTVRKSMLYAVGFGMLASCVASTLLAAEDETGVVTVVADRVSKKTLGHTSKGVPIEEVSLTRRVSYADLDLGTVMGAGALEKRVKTTAEEICRKLDTLYVTEDSGSPDCAKQAVKKADVAVRAAIATAGKSRAGAAN